MEKKIKIENEIGPDKYGVEVSQDEINQVVLSGQMLEDFVYKETSLGNKYAKGYIHQFKSVSNGDVDVNLIPFIIFNKKILNEIKEFDFTNKVVIISGQITSTLYGDETKYLNIGIRVGKIRVVETIFVEKEKFDISKTNNDDIPWEDEDEYFPWEEL